LVAPSLPQGTRRLCRAGFIGVHLRLKLSSLLSSRADRDVRATKQPFHGLISRKNSPFQKQLTGDPNKKQ